MPGPWRTSPASSTGSTPRLGRPPNHDLTARLLDAALDIVAEQAFTRLNAEQLATRAYAGKAAIYRRWSTMDAVVAEALSRCTLVVAPGHTGSLRTDLIALFRPWIADLTRDERAAAGLVSHARSSSLVRDALEEAVVDPITDIVFDLVDRDVARGGVDSVDRTRLLALTVRALWWDRYAGLVQPWTITEVEHLVDTALLPIAQSDKGLRS